MAEASSDTGCLGLCDPDYETGYCNGCGRRLDSPPDSMPATTAPTDGVPTPRDPARPPVDVTGTSPTGA